MKATLCFRLTLLMFATLAFLPNSFAQDVSPEYVVRVIYFYPNDRTPEEDIDAKLDALMKRLQQFYEDEMERHGFGRKTFRLETDARGNTVVHHVIGKYNTSHYLHDMHGVRGDKVDQEVSDRFDRSKNIYLMVVDAGRTTGGVGYGESHNGFAFMTSNGDCYDTGTNRFYLAAHEFAHAFGLEHDLRNGAYVTSFSPLLAAQLSKCDAEWLDVHRYFNNSESGFDTPTTVQILPPIQFPPNAIRLRFTINDEDGLHQVQLRGPVSGDYRFSGLSLIACNSLNGKSNTVEFVTPEFAAGPNSQVTVAVIDVNGNFSRHRYPIREEDVQVDVNNRIDINGDGVIDANDRKPTTLRIVSGDNQHSFSNTWLEKPFVVEVRDADGKPVVGIEVAFRVQRGAIVSALSATNPRTDSNGRAECFLKTADNSQYEVAASVVGTTESVVFNVNRGLAQVLISRPDRPQMYWISERNRFDDYTGNLKGFTGDKVEFYGDFATSAALDTSPDGKLYWIARHVPGKSDCGGVLRGSREVSVNRGSRSEELVILTNIIPVGITIDTTKGKLYWTNSRGNIQCANLDGSNIQNLITGLDSPAHIAVDIAREKLYWTEAQGIQQANLDGSNIQPFATNLGAIGSITVVGSYLYWSEKINEQLGKISRANVNGSNAEDIVTLSNVPVGVAVHIADNRLYWTEARGHIRRASLDGSNIEDIVTGLDEPAQLILNVPSVLPDAIAKTLKIVSGLEQEGRPDAALAKPFVVEVRDQFDNPFPGAQVTFAVTSGGGSLSATIDTTDDNGRAESVLTLGPNPGANTVTVSVTGIQEGETFFAEGIQIAKTLEIVAGDEQKGLPGSTLDKPFAVEVRDQSDKPLPDVEVAFRVNSGGGTLSITNTTTDSSGRAESVLTLGPDPGTNTVEVTVTGIQEKQTFIAEGLRIPKTFQIISGNNQQGLPGAALANPFVVEVRYQSGEPLAGLFRSHSRLLVAAVRSV